MLAAGSDAISVTDRTKWYQQVGPPSELYFQINWKVSYGSSRMKYMVIFLWMSICNCFKRIFKKVQDVFVRFSGFTEYVMFETAKRKLLDMC